MTVVVEYVLIDNIVINSLLILLMLKMLKLKPNKWKVLLSASVGALIALLSPLLPITGIMAILIKLPVALILVVLAEFNTKRLLVKYVVLLLNTFLFGGALIAAFSFLGVTTEQAMELNYSLDLPLGAILGTAVLLAWLIYLVIRAVYRRKNIANFVYTVAVTVRDKTAVLDGFLDSGNRLTDSLSKAPVVIISVDALSEWFTTEECIKIISGKTDGLDLVNAHFMEVGSVGGSGKMLVFEAQGFALWGTQNVGKVCLGVSCKRFKDVFDTKLLLNPLLIN